MPGNCLAVVKRHATVRLGRRAAGGGGASEWHAAMHPEDAIERSTS